MVTLQQLCIYQFVNHNSNNSESPLYQLYIKYAPQPFGGTIGHIGESMLNELEIIEQCKKNDPRAQKKLYDAYSPVLFGICLRYASDYNEAEDILQEAFIKILTKISKYEGTGSFEGWMKRIVVNTAITNFHQSSKHKHHYDIVDIQDSGLAPRIYSDLEFTQDELFGVIKSLPEGYKMVFNLYAIEGFKHKEIGDMLGIDVSTSKSQYSRARKLIQTRLEELSKESNLR